MPFLQGNSTASIVVSGIIVVVAALNLILDFDFIETGVAGGAPQYMEGYGAFGLMGTLIWLYLEILRLLAQSRNPREGTPARGQHAAPPLWGAGLPPQAVGAA